MSEEVKNLGRRGFIIIFISYIIGSFYPFAGGNAGIIMYISSLIISIIGAIFLITAMMKAGEELGEQNIKKNAIRSVLCLAVFFTVGAIQEILFPDISEEDPEYIAFGLFYWFITILGSFFWFKASSLLADKVNVSLIRTGALVLLIGSFLLILIIGSFIGLVGLVLQFLGWNRIEEKPPQEGAEGVS